MGLKGRRNPAPGETRGGGTPLPLPRPERPRESPPAPLQGASEACGGAEFPGFHPGLCSCGPLGRQGSSSARGACAMQSFGALAASPFQSPRLGGDRTHARYDLGRSLRSDWSVLWSTSRKPPASSPRPGSITTSPFAAPQPARLHPGGARRADRLPRPGHCLQPPGQRGSASFTIWDLRFTQPAETTERRVNRTSQMENCEPYAGSAIFKRAFRD